jgi:hypothetical protein
MDNPQDHDHHLKSSILSPTTSQPFWTAKTQSSGRLISEMAASLLEEVVSEFSQLYSTSGFRFLDI